MKILNKSNIYFFLANIILGMMLFYTRHHMPFPENDLILPRYFGAIFIVADEITMSKNIFIDIIVWIGLFGIIGIFSFIREEVVRKIFWLFILFGIVINSLYMFAYITN